ncbi:ABC transporter ATP-binding protein [Phytoactinopolyspora halotolerans]|uniref:ABC transporter ATP-binding protein n=2 Tax=Phytoactinopolyspora halotolerans TaxID=1981512 RepID=A0A6L9S0C8_9ACTN|nr:ABC transporter ATP-binding protein [Phytoactinopolyspora halotolerans]
MEPAPPILHVENLRTQFPTETGLVKAVDGASFSVSRGKTVCVVGESGCGKSVTGRSILQIVDRPGQVVGGRILWRPNDAHEPTDLAALDPRGDEIRRIRGNEIAMVFQEPMTSLSPVHTIGSQIVEAIRLHTDLDADAARARTIEVLEHVGLPRPADRFGAYTFQLSGGMRQRAMIAMALACDPRLLIADEPTTALDVTTQAQILRLLARLQAEMEMSVLFVTHDMGVVAQIADEVVVMYLGTVVETGPTEQIFAEPRHPYTRALLDAIPRVGQRRRGRRLATIRGSVPGPHSRPTGCPFHPRCDYARPGTCDTREPATVALGARRHVRCVLAEEEVAVG